MKHTLISPSERLQWVDIYKGIGIILVVLGHVYQGIRFEIIYLFHMPMFFFISGMLFKSPENNYEFSKKKVKQLIVPYCIFLGANYLVCFIIELINNPHHPGAALNLLIWAAEGGRKLNTWAIAYWFVTCFFFTIVTEAILIKALSRRLLFLVNFGMLLLGYAYSYFIQEARVIENINVVLVAGPIFYIGYLFKELKLTSRMYYTAFLLALFSIAVVIANYVMKLGYKMYFDMKAAIYGIPFLSLIAALSCCVALIPVCQWIAKHPYASKFFSEFGRASLVIMFVHCFIIFGVPFSDNPDYNWIRVLLGLSGSYLAYVVFRQFALSRRYLLGIA